MAECPICLEELVDTHRTPCCGNSIHNSCLTQCLRANHSCPLCRECYQVVEIEVNRIDRSTKVWMVAGMAFTGGIVAALFSVIYCNRIHDDRG